VWGVLVLLAAAGCGGGKGVYPVTGKIQFADGRPATELAGGLVEFDLVGGKVTAKGTIDKGGGFTLTTYREGDGAVAGEHLVLIKPPVFLAFDQATKPDVIDRRFWTYAGSKLIAVVEAKHNTITLTVEPPRPLDPRPAGAGNGSAIPVAPSPPPPPPPPRK
jgi:hypothetical protein